MAVFVITGSTQGIGRALAKAALQAGHSVVLSGRRAETVEAAVAALAPAAEAGRVSGQATDIRDRDQVQALWDTAVARHGRVDVWVNNAGVAHTTHAILDTPPAKVLAMVETNLLGGITASQVAARGLAGQGGGRLFNLLGGGSDGESFPGMGVYGSTKRGLDYFTRALAKELRGTGVIVGRVRPGLVVTEGVIREIHADPANFARRRRFMNLLCDHPDTVAPWLVAQMLAFEKSGSKIAWMNSGKMLGRLLLAPFQSRPDLFAAINPRQANSSTP